MANPIKQAYNSIDPINGIECRWLQKNTIRVTKDGTTTGCDIKFEKYQDGPEYLVSKREHNCKLWVAIAVLREDSQDPQDFKLWIDRTITNVRYGLEN